MHNNSEFFTVKTAAAKLGLKVPTIYQMIGQGIIPAVRLGTRSIRIRGTDLNQILNEGTPVHAGNSPRAESALARSDAQDEMDSQE